jgi:aspartate--ammonia ligase
MNAIRRDEELDNLHSVYVDQWDWEKIISEQDRTLDTLKDAMRRIVTAVCCTPSSVLSKSPLALWLSPFRSV